MAKKYSDNTSQNAGKYIMPIDSYSFRPILFTQVTTSGYLIADANIGSVIKKNDLEFISNNNIWEKIILDSVRRTDSKIILHSFFLFDWFPRSPGLFHTREAYRARQEAKSRIISQKNGFTVYDPHGKQSMLEGGFGTIRLKPINLDNQLYYFMTASDNGICHEGFPIALPEYLYNQVINEIDERGSVVKDLIGILRGVPDSVDDLYKGYKNVPKIYLQVEELKNPKYPKRRSTQEMSVTVASSFISSYEGRSKIYASYIGFNPSQKGELQENVEWMENEYVRGMYKGRILTDFDQTTNHFDYAPFSLNKIMNLEVKVEDVNAIASEMGIKSSDIFTIQNQMKDFIKEANKAKDSLVFISYNHQDIEIAKKVQQRLEAEGFKIIRDEDDTRIGDNIESFIQQSIKKARFTLSIISPNSLESAWVSMETIYQYYAGILNDNRFLPLYTDKTFFDSDFREALIKKAVQKREKLKRQIKKRMDTDIGTNDLTSAKEKIDDLIYNLPRILEKLSNTVCTDISRTNFKRGINKVIQDIKHYQDE